MKKFTRILLIACVMMLAAAMMIIPSFADEADTVATVNDTGYASFADAMTAANGLTGDVKVEIYGAVEFVNGMELNGSYTSITFKGMDADAKITINQSAGGDYLEAHGKTVAFDSLTLAKANPAWSNNSGHMGNYFSIQGGTVTYNACTFPNGACTSGATATYNDCTFKNDSEYGLWVYDDALVTVNGGTIDSAKGIKVYSEDETSVTTTLTVENATFTESVTKKPAVAIGYAAEITLIGITYNNPTADIELDSGSDADCEGIAFVAKDAEGGDISKTLTVVDRSNNGAACGVLVDGEIYTTVTTAAEAATEGSTVTLMYDTTETVEFAEGVELEVNGHTAENVTVKQVEPNGWVTPAYTDTNSIWGEGGGNATESLVVELYEGDKKIASASLNNVGGIINGDVYITWHINFGENNDEYWNVEWAEGYPNIYMAPDKVVMVIDGVAVDENNHQWNGPDNLNKIAALAEGFTGGVKAYTSLFDAFYENRGEDELVVVLLNDCTYDSSLTAANSGTVYVSVNGEYVKKNVAQKVTLDLNGKTFTSTATDDAAIKVLNGASLTVIDSVGGGKIVASNDGIKVGGGGSAATLTVEGGAIEANGVAVNITKNSVLNIDGGTVKGGNYGAVLGGDNTQINVNQGILTGTTAISSNSAYSDTAVSITGGTVSGTALAIYQPQNGTTTISGGTVTGQTAINIKSGSLVITGGTVSATGEKSDYVFTGGGFTPNGDAIVIESAYIYNSAYETPTVSISGGTITSDNGTAVTSHAATDSDSVITGFISGGTFNTALDEACCTNGYELVANENGTYGVQEIETEIVEVSISAGTSLSVSYYVKGVEGLDLEMVFEFNGKSYTVEGDYVNGQYVFVLNQVAPQLMAENIKATLYENGTEADVLEEYSVKEYAQTILDGDYSDALKTLISDMLVYGEAAQKYLGITENLITAGIENLKETVMDDVKLENELKLTNNTCVVSAGVIFDYANRIYFKISASATGTVEYNGTETEISSLTKDANGNYVFVTDAIYASDYASTVTVTVNGETTVVYSIQSYACAMDGTEAEALAKAAYVYGVSAKAYLGQ